MPGLLTPDRLTWAWGSLSVGLGTQEQCVCLGYTATISSQCLSKVQAPEANVPSEKWLLSALALSPAAAMWGCAQLQPLRPAQMHPGGGSRLFLWELDSTELLSHIRKAQSPERPRFWDKRSPCHLTIVRRSKGWLLSLGKWQRWWDPQCCEESTKPNEPFSSTMWVQETPYPTTVHRCSCSQDYHWVMWTKSPRKK